jgi:hypothetical protein
MKLGNLSLHSAGVTAVKQQLVNQGFEIKAGKQNSYDLVVTHENGKEIKLKVFVTEFGYRKVYSAGEIGLSWMMTDKYESVKDPDIFYCFVLLKRSGEEQTRIFILPSTTVAHYLKDSYDHWMRGKSSRDSSNTVRKFVIGSKTHKYPNAFYTPLEDEYENKWEVLE